MNETRTVAAHRSVRLAMVISSIGACAAMFVHAQETPVPDTSRLQTMTARFAPTEIGADLSSLSAADRQVLAKLVAASKVIDALFRTRSGRATTECCSTS